MTFRQTLSVGLFGLALMAAPALAQTPTGNTPNDSLPGKAIYDRACATCHNNPAPGTRTATFTALTGSSAARLREVMSEGGVMAPMAAGLSPDEQTNLIAYLTSGQKAAPAHWSDAMMCSADARTVNVSAPATFAGFGGPDLAGSRHLSDKQAGLKKADFAKMDVAWSIAFPQTQSLGMGVSVLGDTLFFSSGSRVMALDAAKGCAKWVYGAGQSRNTPAIGVLDGRTVIAFSVARDVHVLDAKTGELIWKANFQATDNPGAVRGGVVIYKDKIIVPISASGVGTGMNAKFECCDGHGAVVALSAKDGSKLWEYHTMPKASYNGALNSQGVKQKGPSGAPIWSVPIVDVKRNRIIVTTGENTSYPATDTSDAVIALDADTGKAVWQFQAMASDVWNMACSQAPHLPGAQSGPNCPWEFDTAKPGRDYDFGAGAILAKGKGGKDVILAGQKSGHVWALDAETGKKLWENRIGGGSALGGVHWGITTDGKRLFAPINDPFEEKDSGSAPKPGLYAFNIATGKPAWSYAAKPDCGERAKNVVACETKYGFSAAPVSVDGVVIGGTLDGRLFILDAANGKVVKSFDFAGPMKTTWGGEGKVGSIESHGVSAGAGMVFVSTGYGMFGQTPGNVLIALKPKK